MSIIRVRKKRHAYVQIDKTPLLDKTLSWKARGLMAFLLTKPDDWSVQIKDLVKQSERDGKEALQSGFKELQEAGYVLKRRSQGADGRFSGWETLVFETLEDRQEWEKEYGTDERENQSSDSAAPTNGKTSRRGNRNLVKPESGKTDSGKPGHILINEDQLTNESLVINDLTHGEGDSEKVENASLPNQPEPVSDKPSPRSDQQPDSQPQREVAHETSSAAAIIHPTKKMEAHFQRGGRLEVWEVASNEPDPAFLDWLVANDRCGNASLPPRTKAKRMLYNSRDRCDSLAADLWREFQASDGRIEPQTYADKRAMSFYNSGLALLNNLPTANNP